MTELAESDALEIVQRLISRTEQGSIDWGIWEQGVYEYFASSPRFRYYVKTRDNDGTAPYSLQIYRVSDATAERYTGSGDPPPTEELVSFPESLYSEAIERLYMLARGKALGIDNLKSDILDDLGDS